MWANSRDSHTQDNKAVFGDQLIDEENKIKRRESFIDNEKLHFNLS